MKLTAPQFFSRLKWLDGRPLLQTIEPYRLRLFTQALDSTQYNLVLAGRSKKNWKSTDLVLAALYCLLTDAPHSASNQCYILANDLDQAGDDLALAKLLLDVNPVLAKHLVVKAKVIERRDGRGFLMILPAGDISGSHGKTYRFAGWDEIHGYKSWDLFEALQPDPHRRDALQWITSYASVYHRPGIPLYDWFQQGKLGSDPRMLFSWYAADFTTDDALDLGGTAEEKANPLAGQLDRSRLSAPAAAATPVACLSPATSKFTRPPGRVGVPDRAPPGVHPAGHPPARAPGGHLLCRVLGHERGQPGRRHLWRGASRSRGQGGAGLCGDPGPAASF